MGKDTITLALNGDSISLDDFAKAIGGFQELIEGLALDVAPTTKVNWSVLSLEAGSAIATIQGYTEDEERAEDVEKIVDAYFDVGRSLHERRPIQHSERVQKAARRLVSVINGRVTSVRFETPTDDIEVSHYYEASDGKLSRKPHQTQVVFGAMRGRIQSLSNRGGLRFTLYDLIDDKAISCYLPSGSETIMRDAWGRIAIVEGRIHRSSKTGQVSTIRDVSDVRVLPDNKPKEWRDAIGAAPGFLGNTLPEDAIRRARDE